MNCEHRCNKSAVPKCARHLLQREENEDHRDNVQEDICGMVTSRLQSIYLAVEHMRDRRQRMPVHGVNMGECPGNAAEADAACYFSVLINVARIVVVNEVVPESLAKNKPGQRGEKKADAKG